MTASQTIDTTYKKLIGYFINQYLRIFYHYSGYRARHRFLHDKEYGEKRRCQFAAADS